MLTYFIIVPILIAVLLFMLSHVKAGRAIAILFQAGFTGAAFYLFTLSQQGEILTTIGGYESVLGIVLRADSVSAVFVLITTIFFLIASIYSFHEKDSRLFWFLMFLWQGALVGIFLTRDLFNAFVLIEVVTIVVAILIMFNRDKRSMYDGMFYLMLNVLVIKFYLFGLGYLYRMAGTMDMEVARLALANVDRASQLLPYALMMTSIAFKCALLPLFSWLPKAHGSPAAPSAVSAILSGLHIKCTIYLFLRVQEMFATVATHEFFLVIGIITAVVGFTMAMSQSDIKLILAYSTVSQIGLIFTALSMGSYYSQIGGMYHIVNHALFKGGLFLGAGAIAKAYGTRNIHQIRGVLRRYPLMGIATLIAILGMIGAPFFNGSISKYFMVSDTTTQMNWILTFLSLGTIITFIKYSTMLFGKSDAEPKADVKIPVEQQISTFILGALCFVTGIFGLQSIRFLFNATVYIDALGYLEKAGIFFASLIAGFFIFKYFVNTSDFLKRLGRFELGFRSVCVCIGVFFAALLLTVGVL
ncbi:MAG: proton-conducting membrane transporter [Oscillospiraceae bacterium]|nr:proton-conducting membrane transporter [Oscillospiraceae bacterium]